MPRGRTAQPDYSQLILLGAITYLAFTGGLANIGQWINGLIPSLPTPDPTPTPTPDPTPDPIPDPDPDSAYIDIWRSGSTYYADGGLSNSNFPDLWDSLHATLVSGDTVKFAGNTEYIADRTIKLTKDGITLLGSQGATIRSYSSTIGVILFECWGDSATIRDLTFSGLGYTDNRDQLQPYDLMMVKYTSGFTLDNCVLEHHQQYLLELSSCENFKIMDSIFRYGQNGVATYGTNQGGIIENNLIHDCSQGPIKLRGCTGTIVRYNTIREEYTYWRGFDHLRVLGPDGRGVVGNTQGCQGIYFGVTDPQPNYNCDVYGNTITDASKHGTIQVQDVVDGTWRTGPPNSDGCWFPADSGLPSSGNKFHNNLVDGPRYGVNIANYSTRNVLTVYDNTFTNIVTNNCNLS